MTAVIKFLSYEDVRGFLETGLAAHGLTPVIDPGPANSENLQKLTPNSALFITVGGGAGLTNEQTFDRVFIALRAIGEQLNYDSAETLALTADRLLLSLHDSGMLGSSYTLSVSRAGGAPQLLLTDSADRYHFTASYIAEAETGL